MRNCQLALFGSDALAPAPSLEHGGDVRRGKRKIARPLNTRLPVHVVLRSSRAKREWSMLRSAVAARIRRTVHRQARRYDVRVYRYANVGNHIHLLGQARSRPAFQSFLRVVAGVTARIVTGARRGRPVGRFWDRLAYTRVVSWGCEFRCVGAYVQQNEDEARGLRPHERRVDNRRARKRRCARKPRDGILRATSPP
jgi:REP element-mobilizing transposase RayT